MRLLVAERLLETGKQLQGNLGRMPLQLQSGDYGALLQDVTFALPNVPPDHPKIVLSRSHGRVAC
jgi:hypothetical protein